MNIPPPPPPPPPTIKAPIPATNKALLSSIEKGTKLKKVPESAKNDRSEVKLSNTSTKNGPQMRPTNGVQSSMPGRSRQQPQSAAPNKQFTNMQSELANHMSNSNLRKTSLSTNNPHPMRPPSKSSAPPPNQFNSANNKPPPPPPLNKKPISRSSISEPSRPMSDIQNNVDKPISQTTVFKKVQPPLPNQMNNAIANRPAPSVNRITTNPPPPVPNSLRESVKGQIPSASPPPVPQRVISQNLSNVSLQSNQIRPASCIGSQYKVIDRPPPPIPPMNNSVQSNQKTSPFDQRFKFPEEKYFPKQGASSMKGNHFSHNSLSHLETNSY